ncbi:MAG TPA: NAD-dependent deacylase [Bacteriovoracaceae bacterium]|nr:NAD-dependent deacylase [Bacteriovoracaceae bacterium]
MSYNNIVILTGAGISADSGLSTFRDSGGLWDKYRLEEIATPEAFEENPQLVWKFYSMRKIEAAQAKPNLAHFALVDFTKKNPQKNITLITQNVDGLHHRADSQEDLSPLCMHGSLNESRCTHCGTVYFDDYAYFNLDGDYAPTKYNLCNETQRATDQYLHHYKFQYKNFLPLSPCCNQSLRPHIVWFGEFPLLMEKIHPLLQKCDLFISIGTSGNVYPAAGFLQIAKAHGARTVCLNKEEIIQHDLCDEFISGRAIDIVPRYLNSLT